MLSNGVTFFDGHSLAKVARAMQKSASRYFFKMNYHSSMKYFLISDWS